MASQNPRWKYACTCPLAERRSIGSRSNIELSPGISLMIFGDRTKNPPLANPLQNPSARFCVFFCAFCG